MCALNFLEVIVALILKGCFRNIKLVDCLILGRNLSIESVTECFINI